MALEIYWGSGSPFVWRVMLTLEVKKATYVSHLLEFSKGQTRTPEFLALNPRGKVPTLKEDGFVLSESLAIMAYLDRKFPEPPLFGRSDRETGRIWNVILDSTDYLEPIGQRIGAPIFMGRVAEERDDIRAAQKELVSELQKMEQKLSRQQWLATESLSAADIAVYPFIEVLLRAAGKEEARSLDLGLLPLGETYPALAAWRDRIKALPGYDKTYPPHWRQ